VQLPNLFRKLGESEDPLFQDILEEKPPPDEGNSGKAEVAPDESTLRKLDTKGNPNG
jgi:hypothetical protein